MVSRRRLAYGLSGLAALSAAVAQATPTLTLTLRYAGSTTNTLTIGQIAAGAGLTANPNLSDQSYSSSSSYLSLFPDVMTTAWKHYFDIGVTFNPDAGSTEYFRGAILDLTLSGNTVTFVARDGSSGGTSTKYFPFSIIDNAQSSVLFNTNSDAGAAGDLQGITAITQDLATAVDARAGMGGGGSVTAGGNSTLPLGVPTWIGRIATQILPNPNMLPASITPVKSAGLSFSYFTNGSDGTAANIDTGVTSTSLTVTSNIVLRPSNWLGTSPGSWGDAARWDAGIPDGKYWWARTSGTITLDGNHEIGALRATGPTTILAGTGGALILNGPPVTGDLGDTFINFVEAFYPLTIASDVVLTGASEFYSGSVTLTGNISGTAGIGMYFTGSRLKLFISGNNTFSGGVSLGFPYGYVGGDVVVGSGTALGTGPVTIPLDSTLDLNGQQLNIGVLSGSPSSSYTGYITNRSLTPASLTTTTSTSSTFGQVIRDGAGTVSLIKNGTGTLVLTAANTFSGTTSINGGVLQLDNGSLAGPVVNNAVLAGRGTLTGSLLNNVAVTGPTAVGDLLLLKGAVTGGGNFSGRVQFAGGYSPSDQLKPIRSVTLGTAQFTSGQTLTMEIDGTGADHLTFTTSGALAGILNVSLLDGYMPTAGDRFDLLDGPVTGTFSQVVLPALGPGLAWNSSTLYTDGVLRVAAVPEPAALALLGVPWLLMGRGRRVRCRG